MKLLFALVFIITTSTDLFSNHFPENKLAKNNTIQLALLLDTSGSMDGLIDQAKSQLWKIVNELATTKKDGKSVELQVALFEYGKQSIPADEGYLRNIVPFTQDLDKISDELFKLKTNGGEEYCGRVILNAVDNLQWNKSNDQLKIIFIAGNEPFTQGNIDYKTACKKAVKNGIVVNTIFCGNYDEGVQTMWKAGADISDGKYMNIDHNADIVHIDAPQDAEIIKLGQQLNKTYIAFGKIGKEKKEMQSEQDANSMSVSNEVMVQRSVTKSGGQYKNSTWDLVDAKKDGTLKIEDLKDEELPDEMKKMSVQERKTFIEKKEKEREQIQIKINKLNDERSKYVAQKMLENKNDNTLDAVMIKTIREQAKNKNYSFSK
ncbi:MAG: VWA domain-containing protein [Ignavibacteriaceae bacterium]|nr:VWA domain-containing protein [Ignavibacterium sp.]MCC6255954.1 VWA domain-containing protein [Ignavibacteriaceae bacterium]HMN23031.1 VWA domain-containing protein [Ignavibacteriaceae bacterium]HRN26821.1 VWA domain-containing protein [Ignavibacteriaceae bacterium]HRP93106.1 VWA domain-containing protein [Ignavibacteriaceae bacterium]